MVFLGVPLIGKLPCRVLEGYLGLYRGTTMVTKGVM